MDFKETLRHQWNEACLQLDLPSLTTDTAAKIMAVLYVYGNNENSDPQSYDDDDLDDGDWEEYYDDYGE